MLGIVVLDLLILGKLDGINKPIMEAPEEPSAFFCIYRDKYYVQRIGFRVKARIIAIVHVEWGSLYGILVCIIVGKLCQQ